MNPQTPQEITDAYIDAIETSNYEQARFYLDDYNFRYRSPVINSNDADEFISNISHVGSILKRIDRRRTFFDGNEVCQVLRFVTEFSTVRTTDVMQWTTIRNGKIVNMEAAFDGRVYREMFLSE